MSVSQPPSVNWVLSHKLLPKLMADEPAGMDPRIAPDLARADEILAGMWRGAQAMVGPAPLPIPPRTARVRVGGRDGLAFCFFADRPIDSHFALAAPVEGGWRYLTLEQPMMGDGGVLGEWEGDRHLNHGHVPPPLNLASFLSNCENVLGLDVSLVEGPRGITLTGTVVDRAQQRATGLVMAGFGVVLLLGALTALWMAR